MEGKVDRFYDSGGLDFWEQLLLEDSKMRLWMVEGRLRVLELLGYELGRPDDSNTRYWRDPEVRQRVAEAQWDERSLRARAILQATILDVLQKKFPQLDDRAIGQVERILFIDDLKRLLALIVSIGSEITIRQEILAYSQETDKYHVASEREAQ